MNLFFLDKKAHAPVITVGRQIDQQLPGGLS